MQRLLLCVGLLSTTACHRAGSARSDVPATTQRVTATTTLGSPADAQFARIQTRLEAQHYRIDVADPGAGRLVVTPPGQETKVEV